MKANVLFDSDRYDEAVRLYNRILKDDPSFSRALFMRGKAKFALGAFKGTKMDILEYIDQRGINEEIVEVMANTEIKLGNDKNALSYFELLTLISPYEGKNFAAAAQLAFGQNDRNKACEYWIKAAKLGDAQGAKYASMRCDYNESIHLPSKSEQPESKVEAVEDKIQYDPSRIQVVTNDSVIVEEEIDIVADTNQEESDFIDVSVKTTTPHVDMEASQEIEIDEELTLVLNSGLGKRQVDNLPNILMLSDKSGKVTIDLCVDGSGKVKSADLNNKLTTIFRSSLSSLAIRKAKEIVFMPSLVDEQCGLLVFNIDTDQ